MKLIDVERYVEREWEKYGRVPKVVILADDVFTEIEREVDRNISRSRTLWLTPSVVSVSFEVGTVIILPKRCVVDWSSYGN